MPLPVAEFVQRWKLYSQSERSGSQSHFLDLCDMLGEKHPAASDADGERYAFEKHVGKVRGGKGFADVWLRDHFAWEYKGKHKDLAKAYQQLNDYAKSSATRRCWWSATLKPSRCTPTSPRPPSASTPSRSTTSTATRQTPPVPCPPLDVLRALFGDTDALRPERTDAQVTQAAARQFARLAERLELEERNLGATREEIAHFLMRVLFCLFADSIGLLPGKVFRNLLQGDDRFRPQQVPPQAHTLLFEAMSEQDGIFGEHSIRWFNGGLFDSASTIKLDQADLGILYDVSRNYDWAHVAPAIFGRCSSARSTPPGARSSARTTRQRKTSCCSSSRCSCARLSSAGQRSGPRCSPRSRWNAQKRPPAARGRPGSRPDRESERLLARWIEELTSVRVLDPACGSGNFLYVALRRMLDLWKEGARLRRGRRHLAGRAPDGLALAALRDRDRVLRA